MNPADTIEPVLPKPGVARTAGSSFDVDLFEEVQTAIGAVGGFDAGIPKNFDATLLGQDAKNDAEENYQRGQEIAILIAMEGWTYIKEAMKKMVLEEELEFKKAETDADILRLRRDWKAMEKAVNRIIANVESSASVPHPDKLEESDASEDTNPYEF